MSSRTIYRQLIRLIYESLGRNADISYANSVTISLTINKVDLTIEAFIHEETIGSLTMPHDLILSSSKGEIEEVLDSIFKDITIKPFNFRCVGLKRGDSITLFGKSGKVAGKVKIWSQFPGDFAIPVRLGNRFYWVVKASKKNRFASFIRKKKTTCPIEALRITPTKITVT